jgi:hypothetical protein
MPDLVAHDIAMPTAGIAGRSLLTGPWSFRLAACTQPGAVHPIPKSQVPLQQQNHRGEKHVVSVLLLLSRQLHQSRLTRARHLDELDRQFQHLCALQ